MFRGCVLSALLRWQGPCCDLGITASGILDLALPLGISKRKVYGIEETVFVVLDFRIRKITSGTAVPVECFFVSFEMEIGRKSTFFFFLS